MKKLPHFRFRCCQRLPAKRSGLVYSPERLAVSLFGGLQIPFFLEALEKGVQAPRTDAVPVMREFLDHSQAEDWACNGVVEYMQADEARVEIPVGGRA